MCKWIKNLFRKKKTKQEEIVNYKLVDVNWQTVPVSTSPKTPNWRKHAGLEPISMVEDGIPFTRLECKKVENNPQGWEWMTAAISLGNDNPVGDGKFECEARFKMAPTAWPAIWMTHPNGAANDNETYYEVDICEYWHVCNKDSDYYCNTTFHYPESQRNGKKTKYKGKVKLKVLPNEPHEGEDGRLFTETDWNKFSCTWDEKHIKVFVNDTKVMEIENDGDKNHFPTDSTIRTFNIILSMQYDSNSLKDYGCVLSTDDLPLYMDVKNVRVYKKI